MIATFKVNLNGSLFDKVQFSETKFEKIILTAVILEDLKLKTTTFHDLQFSEKYPVRIFQSKNSIEVSDSDTFQKIFAELFIQ